MLNIAKWSKWEFIGAIALEPALLTWKASTELTIVVTIPVSTLTTTIFYAGYISTQLGLGHLLGANECCFLTFLLPVQFHPCMLEKLNDNPYFLIHYCLYCYSLLKGFIGVQPTPMKITIIGDKFCLHLTKVQVF